MANSKKRSSWNAGKAFGLYATRFYKIWQNMKTRCTNPNSKNFLTYGKRGIYVCNKWFKFEGFYLEMYPSYKDNLTLERIDNNLGYFRKNCRWATRKEQANNTRRNHLFEYKGISDTIVNWANYLKIKRSTLSMRIYIYKWDIEKAFFYPVRKKGTINS